MKNAAHKPNESKNLTVGAKTAQFKEVDRRAAHQDLRPSAIKQRKMVDLADSSSKTLQKKEIQQKGAVSTNSPIQRNKTGLPDNLKTGVENLSGHSMDDVKVHYNSPEPAGVQAHAYAQGSNIHVATGQEQHLPHEAWHVAQQKQGRVQPTTEVGGMPVNDSPALESEADSMGAKAAQMKKNL